MFIYEKTLNIFLGGAIAWNLLLFVFEGFIANFLGSVVGTFFLVLFSREIIKNE